jgi:methylmalonyl-CoA/ethylmalonyl-CoA epimerase
MTAEPSNQKYAVTQVAIVVENLDATVEALRTSLGWEPWDIFDVVEPEHHDIEYEGEPGSFGVRAAICRTGAVDFEVIQPLYGKGPQSDFLEKTGGGLHHILVRPQDPTGDGDLQKGDFGPPFPVLVAGTLGETGRYAYLDATKPANLLVECVIGTVDRRSMPNFHIYPEPE